MKRKKYLELDTSGAGYCNGYRREVRTSVYIFITVKKIKGDGESGASSGD